MTQLIKVEAACGVDKKAVVDRFTLPPSSSSPRGSRLVGQAHFICIIHGDGVCVQCTHAAAVT